MDVPGYQALVLTPRNGRYDTDPVEVLRSPSCTGRLEIGAAQPVLLRKTCARKVVPRGSDVGRDAAVRDNR